MSILAALALTGYGHYTTMRVEAGGVRGLDRHLTRLQRDCRALFGVELDPMEAVREIRRAVDGVTLPVTVRVTVSDPELKLDRPGGAASPVPVATLRPAGELPAAPLRVLAVEHRRGSAEIKHASLFEVLRLRRAAQIAGYDDALLHERVGVSEGVSWNVGFVLAGAVVWPSAPALAGVTTTLLRAARPGDAVRPVSLAEAREAEAAFAVASTYGVRPITAIGPERLPAEHPLLTELAAAYEAVPFTPL